ncbi:MAG: hypothetical protein WCF90_04585 [Methanomicrobiales archaeon]
MFREDTPQIRGKEPCTDVKDTRDTEKRCVTDHYISDNRIHRCHMSAQFTLSRKQYNIADLRYRDKAAEHVAH